MSQQPQRRYASVAGCADPRAPYKPTGGNTCETCQTSSDVTCHDFPKKATVRANHD